MPPCSMFRMSPPLPRNQSLVASRPTPTAVPHTYNSQMTTATDSHPMLRSNTPSSDHATIVHISADQRARNLGQRDLSARPRRARGAAGLLPGLAGDQPVAETAANNEQPRKLPR